MHNQKFNQQSMKSSQLKKVIHNNVIPEKYKSSTNFYNSDKILHSYLNNKLSKEAISYMLEKWTLTGERAAQKMDCLSIDADKEGPKLKKRDFFGETIDEIKFHPAYNTLLGYAVDSEMFTVKWKPELRNKFNGESHRLGFSSGYLYAMSESGQYCPLCMTDGVARLIDLYCANEDKARLLPHIYTSNVEDLYTGAMFLTEKSGGSDVGRNIVKASHKEGNLYNLNGEKWFCSNVNAEIIFALARTDENVEGTKGLSIFLIEKTKANGEKNPLPIIRLKDKLGVRSMASAECLLTNTEGKLVGKEFEGFRIMAEMLNLSRLYNSIAALSCSRRALIEAYTFVQQRESFGKKAVEHTLIKDKLNELGSLHVANFYLTWRAIESLDKADNGNEKEAELLRLITPMVKKWSAEKGVYLVRESMELMGGIGYIEDGILPKIMRDVLVLPIWEGAGNIMTLDMLRASFKSNGLKVIFEEIQKTAHINSEFEDTILEFSKKLFESTKSFESLDRENLELTAKYFFEDLTTLFQLSLVVSEINEKTISWTLPTARFLKQTLQKENQTQVFTEKEIAGLLAWEI